MHDSRYIAYWNASSNLWIFRLRSIHSRDVVVLEAACILSNKAALWVLVVLAPISLPDSELPLLLIAQALCSLLASGLIHDHFVVLITPTICIRSAVQESGSVAYRKAMWVFWCVSFIVVVIADFSLRFAGVHTVILGIMTTVPCETTLWMELFVDGRQVKDMILFPSTSQLSCSLAHTFIKDEPVMCDVFARVCVLDAQWEVNIAGRRWNHRGGGLRWNRGCREECC
mmetsp:Transcript_85263/g.151013  ORF Transcript_85263/g.151013 Transcript_85263/m.151013 type:complete len:228 (-) Transcript_85263:395-1078(-)